MKKKNKRLDDLREMNKELQAARESKGVSDSQDTNTSRSKRAKKDTTAKQTAEVVMGEGLADAEQTAEVVATEEVKNRDWYMIVAITCFVIAGLLLSMGPIRTMLLSQFQDEANQTLETITVADIQSNQQAEAEFDFTQVQPLDLEGVMSARLSNEPYLTIGALAVPNVKLNLPIIRGISDASLYIGAGTMKPDQQMGERNYTLAGHNYPGKPTILFSPLEKLKNGDKIYITDLAYIYEYETTNITTVDEHQVDILDDVPGEIIITLMKCNDNDRFRDIYQGKLIQKVSVDEAPEEMKQIFNVDFTQREN